jgi:hypothetical protein
MAFVVDRRRHRVFAFAASTALTLGLLFSLAHQGSLRLLHVVRAKPDNGSSRAIVYIDSTKFPPPSTPPPPLPSTQAPKAAATLADPPPSSKPRSQPNKTRPDVDVLQPRETIAITLPTEPSASQPRLPQPTNPLRLDADTMRKANAHSKGAVQSLADSADEPLQHGAHRSDAERREESIAKSGKPDCISPNQGGDILTTPILIAIQAARGKCK